MRKTLVTIFCSALIAATSIQMAAVAEHHNDRKKASNRSRSMNSSVMLTMNSCAIPTTFADFSPVHASETLTSGLL
jgi:hypothetical protein